MNSQKTPSEPRQEVSSEIDNCAHSNRRTTILMLAALPILIVGSNAIMLLSLLAGDFGFFPWVKKAYALNTVWLPFLMVAFGGVGLVYTKHQPSENRTRIVSACCCGIAFLLWGIHIYATHIEPYRLQIKTVVLHSPKIHKPLKILHISDIQSASVGDYEYKVFERIQELDPDIILHTGDLVQPVRPATWETEIPKMDALLSNLQAQYGFISVLGDTDQHLSHRTSEWPKNVTMLISNSCSVDLDESTISILGLSLEQSRWGDREAVEQWLQAAEDDTFTILLGHAPDYILSVDDLEIDLCLAGHTHGGQIRLPFIGPLLTLTQVPRDWARGFHEAGQTVLNVSAGIGCEHHSDLPSIRFLCPPEMTLIQVLPSRSP